MYRNVPKVLGYFAGEKIWVTIYLFFICQSFILAHIDPFGGHKKNTAKKGPEHIKKKECI